MSDHTDQKCCKKCKDWYWSGETEKTFYCKTASCDCHSPSQTEKKYECHSCNFEKTCTEYKGVMLCKKCKEEAIEDAKDTIVSSTPIEQECDQEKWFHTAKRKIGINRCKDCDFIDGVATSYKSETLSEEFDSEKLEELINGCRIGQLDSRHIHDFIRSLLSKRDAEIRGMIIEMAEPYDGAKWLNQIDPKALLAKLDTQTT